MALTSYIQAIAPLLRLGKIFAHGIAYTYTCIR
jgi:hypothetical protein